MRAAQTRGEVYAARRLLCSPHGYRARELCDEAMRHGFASTLSPSTRSTQARQPSLATKRGRSPNGRSLRLRLLADTSPGDRRVIDLGELGTMVGAVRSTRSSPGLRNERGRGSPLARAYSRQGARERDHPIPGSRPSAAIGLGPDAALGAATAIREPARKTRAEDQERSGRRRSNLAACRRTRRHACSTLRRCACGSSIAHRRPSAGQGPPRPARQGRVHRGPAG
jgi:hypothetical protein